MSAHLILPPNEDVESDVVDLIHEVPRPLPAEVARTGVKPGNRWLGILGLVVVLAIIASTVYSIAKYLW